MFKNITLSLLILCVLTALHESAKSVYATATPAHQDQCFSTKWPHEKSSLQPDPTLIFGKLDNGFRYILKQNTIPKNRVALYLNVQAGSLNESESERGYAHYLEHMLFNGSTNFPPGSLISYFQSIGMSFGADTNAYTSYDESVYKIFLPQGNTQDIQKGLKVMVDYAQGALLMESEVNREKGVILSEKTARDSVSYRTRIAKNKKAFNGTLLPERSPIGITETIETVNSSKLRKFYDRWYRPENMTLVAVGDFVIDQVEQEVRSAFAGLQGRGEQPSCPDIGSIANNDIEAFYYYEPHTGSVKVSIESYWSSLPENDSTDLQFRQLTEYIATLILRKRLEKLALTNEQFSSPAVFTGSVIEGLEYVGITASTTSGYWKQSLTLLENSLRQILTFGITSTEFTIARAEVLSYFESQALTASSRKSRSIARNIIQSLNMNRVFQSPQQEKELVGRLMKRMDHRTVHAAMLRLWERRNKLVTLSGNVKVDTETPEKEIIKTYDAATIKNVTAYREEQQKIFPYVLSSNQTVEPVDSTYHSELDARTYTYANGVVLNVKQTDFEKNEVRIAIRFGQGKKDEARPGIAMVTESVINSSGSGKLTQAEIKDALAGTSINYDFQINTSASILRGKALIKDVEPLIQTLYSIYSDPGIRKEVFRNTMRRYEQMYASLQTDVWGTDALYTDGFLSGGNSLYSMAKWDEVKSIEFHQLKKWAKSLFGNFAPEISIVGDVDIEDLLSLINIYFGTLNTHSRATATKEYASFPFSEKLNLSISSEVDKALVVYAWKTADLSDIQVVRRLKLLALVIKDRLREVVREKLGVAYSPSVYNFSSQNLPDFGIMYIKIITETMNVDAVKNAVKDVVSELISAGIEEDLLIRVKQPLLTSLKDRVQTNSYWLNAVLAGSSENPDQLSWPSSLFQDNAAINAQELEEYAKKYLQPEKAAIVEIKPNEK